MLKFFLWIVNILQYGNALKVEKFDQVNKLILTGSGGPFRQKSIKEFPNIKKEDASLHPNWDMGKKISIDSATMMNKA